MPKTTRTDITFIHEKGDDLSLFAEVKLRINLTDWSANDWSELLDVDQSSLFQLCYKRLALWEEARSSSAIEKASVTFNQKEGEGEHLFATVVFIDGTERMLDLTNWKAGNDWRTMPGIDQDALHQYIMDKFAKWKEAIAEPNIKKAKVTFFTDKSDSSFDDSVFAKVVFVDGTTRILKVHEWPDNDWGTMPGLSDHTLWLYVTDELEKWKANGSGFSFEKASVTFSQREGEDLFAKLTFSSGKEYRLNVTNWSKNEWSTIPFTKRYALYLHICKKLAEWNWGESEEPLTA